MELFQVDNRWFEFEALTAWSSLVGDQKIEQGDKCYVRKNDKQPDYYDIVFKQGEFLHGAYIAQRYAAGLIKPLRPMKEQHRITGLWNAYWKAKYIK